MTTTAMAQRSAGPPWIDALVLVGSGFFVVGLAVSAAFVPSIRVLHVLQALIYVAVVVLVRRRSAWGFGAGVAIAVFWNYLVLVASPIGRQGIAALEALVRTGQVQRPDGLLQLFAGTGHILIIIGCLAGFLGTRPDARQWARFVGGGALVLAYFVAIILTVAPPDIAVHLREALGR